MTFRLLNTKFHIPPLRPGGVIRQRLLERLNTGLAEFRKLTLVSAPAGYGKTTLMVDWIHSMQESACVGWISLDDGDNDPNRLLNYLTSAFSQFHEGVGKTAQELLSLPQLPHTQVILDELLNDLAAFTGSGVLVLDDFHTLTNPQTHEVIEYFLDHQPAHIQLVLLTREDPPLPIARMRARRQITEIRADDLRFTLEEAVQFFNHSMHLHLDKESIHTLESRTEGWPVGLQLAALALQHLPDPYEFIHTFHGTHRYILDYLSEEVLRQQNEEIRCFLTQTSVLEKFNAPLCDAMTGRPDSRNFITLLEQSNLFIIPLDNERNWYRYHPLFADYLRAGLTRLEQAALYERASHWFEENDLVFDAVNYALLSKNIDLAADVIERVIQQVSAWSGGDIAALMGWLDMLPDPLLRSRPALCLHASRIRYIMGQMDLSENYLNHAEKLLSEQLTAIPDRQNLMALAAVYRGSLAIQHGDLRSAIERSTFALSHIPTEDLYSRSRAAQILGIAYELTGDLARASQNLIQASDLAHDGGITAMAVVSRSEAALVQINQGKLNAADQTIQQAIQFAEGAHIPQLGFAQYVLAQIAWERNDLASAEKLLLEGLDLSRRSGLIDDQRYALITLAHVRQSGGDDPAALACIEQAHAMALQIGVRRLITLSGANVARIQLAADLVEQASRWAQEYLQQHGSVVQYTRDFEEMMLARIYLAKEETDQAQALLSPLYEQAAAAGRNRTCIEAAILLALSASAKHDSSIARRWLRQALQLAQSEGFRRVFLDEGSPIAGLLPHVRAEAPEFVDHLLNELSKNTPSPRLNASDPLNDRFAIPLSEQERRVLDLMMEGKSNRQIADVLVISIGTAKWHVHNILRKLGVNNRPQAIARVRQLRSEY